MNYRRLGRSGLQVSTLVLGTMNFGRPTEKAEVTQQGVIDGAVDQVRAIRRAGVGDGDGVVDIIAHLTQGIARLLHIHARLEEFHRVVIAVRDVVGEAFRVVVDGEVTAGVHDALKRPDPCAAGVVDLR